MFVHVALGDPIGRASSMQFDKPEDTATGVSSACKLGGAYTVIRHRLDQRGGQCRDLADPGGHCGTVEPDPLARVDAGLAIERQVIAAFADQDTCTPGPA